MNRARQSGFFLGDGAGSSQFDPGAPDAPRGIGSELSTEAVDKIVDNFWITHLSI
jgi:hypothetical protein